MCIRDSILDVDMPKKNGLTLVETVHEKNPNAEVLILSAFPEYGVDAVNIGCLLYTSRCV